MSHKPTGKTRYRIGWRKRVVLQIEVSGIQFENCGAYVDSHRVRYWRDARIEDLSEIGLVTVQEASNAE